MLPFPKRPAAPNEYDLNTGDYVAYDASSQPSRQPLWGRQIGTPHGMGSVQVAPHVRADMQAYAPAPHSLAPVALGQHAQATGSYRSQPTVMVKTRPDMSWGITLALAGALLGGVLGVTMNNGKHRAAEAQQPMQPQTAMAAAQPAATQAPVSMAPQPATPPATPAKVAAPQPLPVAVPATPAPQPPTNPFAAAPGTQPAPFPTTAPVAPPPPAPPATVAVKNPTVAPPPPKHPSHPAPPPPKHPAPHGNGMSVAAKVQPPPAPPAPAKGGTEEQRLLREAKGETGFSLGGSN